MTHHSAERALVAFAIATLLVARPGVSIAQSGSAADTLRVPAARIRAWQMGLARPDRLEHASLSFTLAAGAGIAGSTRRSSFLFALGLGTLKELRDIRHGGFDPLDLAADAMGAALGARAGAAR